ncbi:hypothetical protein BU16DRAFT_590214 [Lophium mytilinum]|uniref:CENP-V/GFA domain-containing protein n=1 Tax=Lophium mytilinum TaxID=390894 RepID=A0A6A6QS77_9PEZI|nr:hypothetical protein BU16DRAFT_590214 [Lophium mytilinum]
MSNSISGKCLCGALKYEFDAGEWVIALCHCAKCQISSGSVFSYNACIPASSFRLLSPPASVTVYRTEGPLQESGHPSLRNFCNVCGSTCWTQCETGPDTETRYVKMGTVVKDGQEGFWGSKPVVEVYRKGNEVGWVPRLAGGDESG